MGVPVGQQAPCALVRDRRLTRIERATVSDPILGSVRCRHQRTGTDARQRLVQLAVQVLAVAVGSVALHNAQAGAGGQHVAHRADMFG